MHAHLIWWCTWVGEYTPNEKVTLNLWSYIRNPAGSGVCVICLLPVKVVIHVFIMHADWRGERGGGGGSNDGTPATSGSGAGGSRINEAAEVMNCQVDLL